MIAVAMGATLAPGAPAAAQTSVRVGQTVAGWLGSGDAQREGGRYVDTWPFEGQAGQPLTVTMRSQDLDAFLIIRGPNSFAQQNDDVAENDHTARLILRLPASGSYRIFATSYAAGESGNYSLSLEGGGPTGVPYGRAAWAAGNGRLSRDGFQYGTGPGTAEYLQFGTGPLSAYFFAYGTARNSEYDWRNGQGPGSAYFWRNGQGRGSSYHWRNGDGCLSERGWSIGAQCTDAEADMLLVLCVARVVHVEYCDAVNSRLDEWLSTRTDSRDTDWLRRMRGGGG
tara:strand:- start:35387 stop:36235 length:849 start_codon:yes stop_codon:yes gene_type:complete